MGAKTSTLHLPDEITPELAEILGTICYQVIDLASAFRLAGRTIEKRAEAEQAYCIHWFLKLYAEHGAGWRDAASAELKRMRDTLYTGTAPTEEPA